MDDELALLECYRRILQRELEITTPSSCEEGLVLLRNHGPFPVVISDMQMPGMNGVQFLARMRQVAPKTIRLLLSGRIDLKGAVDAVNEGRILRSLLKPCEKSVLTEAINTALACYHRQERKEERVRLELSVRVSRAARG